MQLINAIMFLGIIHASMRDCCICECMVMSVFAFAYIHACMQELDGRKNDRTSTCRHCQIIARATSLNGNEGCWPLLPGSPLRWGVLQEQGGVLPGPAQAKAAPPAQFAGKHANAEAETLLWTVTLHLLILADILLVDAD